jgi:hypothetical protein
MDEESGRRTDGFNAKKPRRDDKGVVRCTGEGMEGNIDSGERAWTAGG